MSESAKNRIQAIGGHLGVPPVVPPVVQVAPGPETPRVAGKVIIVTGKPNTTTPILTYGFYFYFHFFFFDFLIYIVQNVMITISPKGANSILGIGRASAHQFAKNGAKAVYLCDYDGSNLEAHRQEIGASWPNVEIHTRQFDAADEKAVQEVVNDAIKRYGRLDVFFANAGTAGPMSPFTDLESGDFMDVMRVNTLRSVPLAPFLTGLPNLTHHFIITYTFIPYEGPTNKLSAYSWPPSTPHQP